MSEWGIAGLAVVAVAGLGLVALPAIGLGVAVMWLAWWRGWEPHQLRWYVIWAWVSLPVLGIVLTGFDPLGPVTLYTDTLKAIWDSGSWGDFELWGAAAATAWVWAIPIGWTLGFIGWARYRSRMELGQSKAAHHERHRRNMRDHQEADAKRRARFRAWPLIKETKEGVGIVLGPCIERVERVPRHPVWKLLARDLGALTIPYQALKQHMLMLAAPGRGKTVALLRISLGALVAAWKEHAAGRRPRPLLVYMNCKGGPEAREDALEWVETLDRFGIDPTRTGAFGVGTRLNMWELPAEDLEAALHDLIRTENEYYQQVNEAALHLVVSAPRAGTPQSSAEFLARINREWLEDAWRGHPVELEAVAALYEGHGSQGRTILLQYYNLFRKLKMSFDAGYSLGDFDALYVVAEGGAKRRLAAAQVNTVIKLITSYLTDPAKPKRDVTILIDEWSAIADEMSESIEAVVEQFRSLNGSVLVVAQSEQGLGPDADTRMRLATSCAGGHLMLQTKAPGLVADMAGTVRRPDVSNVQVDGKTTGAASSRWQDAMAIDPNRVRQFEPGEIVYSRDANVEFGRVVPVGDLAKARFWEQPEMRQLVTRHKLPIQGVAKHQFELEAEQKAIIEGSVGDDGNDDGLTFGKEVL